MNDSLEKLIDEKCNSLDAWNIDKKHIAASFFENENEILTMKVFKGEIFNCVIGENLGHEQCDTRPVVIISSNFINCRTSTVLAAPLSTNVVKKTIIKNGRERKVLRFSTQILLRPTDYSFLSAESVVKIDQMKTVSKDRLLGKLGNLNADTIKFLDRKICKYLDIEL